MTQDELGTLVVCSLRYSFGRTSYMPSMVGAIIKKYWHDLGPNDQSLIVAEIRRELQAAERRDGWLGDEIIHGDWQDLVEELESMR